MKVLKNNKGSTLTTAIIVLLVVLILTGGMYMIAVVYFQDSEQNHNYRQAYLFAKSECKVFSQYLTNNGDKDNPYYPPKENNSEDTKITTDITLSRNTESSKNVVKWIWKNTVTYRWYGDNEIKYKVTVNYKGQTSTVTLSCTKVAGDSTNRKWTYLYE